MFCSNCGNEIAPGTRFCSGCGTPIAAAPVVPSQDPEPVQPESTGAAPEVPAPQEVPVTYEQPAPEPQVPVTDPAPPAPAVYEAAPVQPDPAPPAPVMPEVQAQPVQSMPGQPAPVQAAAYEAPAVAPAPAAPAPAAPAPAPAPIAQAQPVQQDPAKAKKEKAPKPAKAGKEKPAKTGKKKKLWIIPVVAAVLAVAVGVGGFFIWQDKKKTKEAKDSYGDLCDMTSLGAQSYLYARILTERLLETDLATADPEETERLFKECIAAWEATGEVSEDMQTMAETLSENGDADRLKPASGGNFLRNLIAGRFVNAAGGGDEDNVSEVLPADESIEQCAVLGEQINADSSVCLTRIRQLQQVYNGRATNYEEWNTVVEQTSVCFSNVVFLSGEVINGDDTITYDGQPRSVRQLSTEPKPGATTIENTDILIDVGSRSSTFVMSSTDSITINQDEMEGIVSSGGSTISMSTHTRTTTEVSMTFHRTSFTSWFILDSVGGFTITRGDKDDDGLLTPPEVESGNIVPEPVCRPIVEWLPPIGAEDISNTRNIIIGEEIEIEEVETHVTSTILTEQIEVCNAGSGEITVSAIWGTYDDLDLHVITPNGNRIYYGNRTADGGTLDVDMNARSYDLTDTPIENIYFPAPQNGHYKVYLRNYRDRTEDETHWIVRVTIGGEVQEFEGDIDTTSTEVLVYEFDYEGSYTQTTITYTEEYMDTLVTTYGVGSGDITVSLTWDTWDDIDLHIITPDESHIYYGNKTAGGGVLDHDANAGGERTLEPIENTYFAVPSNGHYRIYIHNYCERSEETSTNYFVRVTIDGESQLFMGTIDGTGTTIDILEFDYSGATGVAQTSYTGHTYAFIDTDISWTQARFFAESMGGHLVAINDEAEQQFLQSRFPETFGWIGLVNGSTDWGWVTGEPVDYTNICEEQPLNYDETELFGFMYNDMQWGFTYNDDCEYHRGFYIEWDTVLEGATDGVLSEAMLDQILSSLNAGSGDITISLLWDSQDDLDLHVFTPDGSEIYYGNRSAQNGTLDVDANTSSNMMDNPVENIYFESPYNGQYWIYVDDYCDRSDGVTSFIIRITIGGESQTFNGTIDGTTTSIEIGGFEYTGGTDAPVDENTLDDVLNSLEAGEGEITISMLWDSQDDLDLHVFTPDGSEIYYGNREAQGGNLDIDANAGGNMMDNPVENVFFATPENGTYIVKIKDYSDRSEGTTNYIVRITVGGQSQTFTGTIDSSGTTIDITSFVYGGNTGNTPDENTLDDVLNSLEAGEGEITISMLWDSQDDLDLHVFTPDGSEIYYGNRDAQGGNLDIDANAGGNMMDNPVENVYFSAPAGGTYMVRIKDYSDRSEGTTNYIVRITVGGQSQTYSGTIDSSGTVIDIASFNYGG